LIVRLAPEEGDEALGEPHVREFDFTGRTRSGWVLVEPGGIEADDQLNAWIQRPVKVIGASSRNRGDLPFSSSKPSNVNTCLLIRDVPLGYTRRTRIHDGLLPNAHFRIG
jgi:hypothetical protein